MGEPRADVGSTELAWAVATDVNDVGSAAAAGTDATDDEEALDAM